MLITIRNLTPNSLSTSVGVVLPHATVEFDLDESQYITGVDELLIMKQRKLIDLTVADERALRYSLFNGTGAINASLTLYVETTGNDRNPGTNILPFKTVQAALNSLPTNRQAPVTIKLGVGTFSDSWKIAGFNILGNDIGSSSKELEVQGTMIPATATTGTNIGTVDSAANVATGSTVGDSTQSWTVDNFKGKMLRITSGAALDTYSIITSNTSNVLTLPPSISITNFNGSTYEILDWGTVFDSAEAKITLVGSSDPDLSLVYTAVLEDTCSLKFLKFISYRAIVANGGSNPIISECSFESATSGSVSAIAVSTTTGNCLIRIYRSFFLQKSSTSTFFSSSSTTLSFVGCFFQGVGTSGTSPAIQSGLIQRAYTQISQTRIENFATGLQTFGSGQFSVNTTVIDTCTTGVKINSFSQCSIGGGAVTNCTTGFWVLNDNSSLRVYSTILGTGTTTGILVQQGGAVRFASSVSGFGATEVDIDGTTTTIAAIKGLTPKVSRNADWGSMVYQEL